MFEIFGPEEAERAHSDSKASDIHTYCLFSAEMKMKEVMEPKRRPLQVNEQAAPAAA